MKKTVLFMLFLSLVVILAACGGSESPKVEGTPVLGASGGSIGANIGGPFVLQENFDNKKNGWDDGSGPDSRVEYVDKYYEIEVKSPNYAQWSNPNDFNGTGDFILEVDALKNSGPDDGDFGLVCGYVDENNFYVLAIDNLGTAEIVKYKDGKDEMLAYQEESFTPAQQYSLVASCIQGELKLYVNGQETLSVTDPDAFYGTVGLYGGTFDTGEAVYHFDNFGVRSPK